MGGDGPIEVDRMRTLEPDTLWRHCQKRRVDVQEPTGDDRGVAIVLHDLVARMTDYGLEWTGKFVTLCVAARLYEVTGLRADIIVEQYSDEQLYGVINLVKVVEFPDEVEPDKFFH